MLPDGEHQCHNGVSVVPAKRLLSAEDKARGTREEFGVDSQVFYLFQRYHFVAELRVATLTMAEMTYLYSSGKRLNWEKVEHLFFGQPHFLVSEFFSNGCQTA